MSYDEPKPDLRASDADREATAKRLHFAAVEGRLDPFELDERLSAAYAAKTCKQLARLTADVTPPPPAPQMSARPVFYRSTPSANGWAIASLACGLLWMWWIGSALAILFGHMALRQIEASRGRQGGRGLAVACIALGYIGAVMLLLALGSLVVD
jgi:hypothetical protein